MVRPVHLPNKTACKWQSTVRCCALTVLAIFIVLASSCAGMVKPASAQRDFTLVVFPDLQYMVANDVLLRGRGVTMWRSMFEWVVKNRKAENIRAVLSVGDVTDHATSVEFKVASEGFGQIEAAGIPCVPIVGNHDYDTTGGGQVRRLGDGARDRRVTGFDSVFGQSRFEGKSWYGGNLNGSHANYYVTLNVDRWKFLIVALEFYPRHEAVAWASRVIDAHPDAETIILTHGYLNPDGTRVQQVGQWWSHQVRAGRRLQWRRSVGPTHQAEVEYPGGSLRPYEQRTTYGPSHCHGRQREYCRGDIYRLSERSLGGRMGRPAEVPPVPRNHGDEFLSNLRSLRPWV